MAGDGLVIETLSGYQAEASVTHRPEWAQERLLANYGLGIAGEAGEVADLLKKHLYHGRPLDQQALEKELGDVLWYVAAICETMDWCLADIATMNIEKLRARHHGGGFDPSYHKAQEGTDVG